MWYHSQKQMAITLIGKDAQATSEFYSNDKIISLEWIWKQLFGSFDAGLDTSNLLGETSDQDIWQMWQHYRATNMVQYWIEFI